jgi:molybdenum cofactor biosynthesis enzyme MoaA
MKLKEASRTITKREEITVGYKCNLECRFCYYGCSFKDNMRHIDEIKKDILFSKRRGIEEIELSGGEPMLHGQIEAIVGFCQDQGFRTICMITNGILLKDIELMRSLKHRGLNEFLFSLHGSNSRTHNYLTQGETFSYLLQAIENAKTLGIPSRINVVVTKANVKDLIRIADLVVSLRPFMVNFLVSSPLGFSRNFASEMSARYSLISSEVMKAVDIVKDIMKVRVRYIPFCFMKGYEKYVCNVHQLHHDPYEWDYVVREQIHNGLFYKWAKILVGLFHIPLGRLLGQNIDRSFHEAILKVSCLVNAYKPFKCRSCRYYFICDGLWKGYVSLYGTGELNPIRGRKIIDPAFFMVN